MKLNELFESYAKNKIVWLQPWNERAKKNVSVLNTLTKILNELIVVSRFCFTLSRSLSLFLIITLSHSNGPLFHHALNFCWLFFFFVHKCCCCCCLVWLRSVLFLARSVCLFCCCCCCKEKKLFCKCSILCVDFVRYCSNAYTILLWVECCGDVFLFLASVPDLVSKLPLHFAQ